MTDTERTPRESAETGRATLGFDERFRPPPPSLRLYAAMVLVACAAAGFAIALRTLLDLASALALGDPSLVEGLRRAPAWMRFVGPTIGAALGALVVRWARRLPPSGGVSAVMEASSWAEARSRCGPRSRRPRPRSSRSSVAARSAAKVR